MKNKLTHKCTKCDFRYSINPEMIEKYGDHATMCPKPGCGGTLQANKKR